MKATVFGGCASTTTKRVEFFLGHDGPPAAPTHSTGVAPFGAPLDALLVPPAGGTVADPTATGYEADLTIPANWATGEVQVTAMCESDPGAYAGGEERSLVSQVLGPVTVAIIPASAAPAPPAEPTTGTAHFTG